jgi:hypothetical protein
VPKKPILPKYEIENDTLARVCSGLDRFDGVCRDGGSLAQATGWEDSGVGAILGRIIGHGSLNAAMLLIVHAPVFAMLRRWRAINPAVGTLIGVLIPLTALLLISNPTATTWSEKLSETTETYIDHPELFASEWSLILCRRCSIWLPVLSNLHRGKRLSVKLLELGTVCLTQR